MQLADRAIPVSVDQKLDEERQGVNRNTLVHNSLQTLPFMFQSPFGARLNRVITDVQSSYILEVVQSIKIREIIPLQLQQA